MAEPFETWFRSYLTPDRVRLRLVCFPHAGGAAGFYRPWARALPPDVELLAVQYPGRQDRMREAPASDIETMADQVVSALPPDRPVALFGHSMGASVAHEAALRLPDSDLIHLIVSGRPGPQRLRPNAKHLLDDDALWDEVASLGGTEQEVIDHPELRGLVLPSVRGDYRISELYRPPVDGPVLGCPVLVCLGDRDPEVTLDEARGWAVTTKGEFGCRSFPGGHFYFVPDHRSLLAELARCLA